MLAVYSILIILNCISAAPIKLLIFTSHTCMIQADLFGVPMPLFMLLSIGFSYSLWSKFLNKGKLKVENIDQIFDIFILSSIILLSLLELTIAFPFIINILNLKITTFESVEPQIIWIIPIVFLGISLKFRGTVGTKNNLVSGLSALMIYHLIVFLLYISWSLLIVTTFLFEVFSVVPILLVSLFSFSFLCFIIANERFKIGKSLKRAYFKSITRIVFLCVVIILSFYMLGRFAMPSTKYGPISISEYHVYDYPEKSIYSKIQVPLYINNFGIIPIINTLSFKYEKFDLDMQGMASDNFKILLSTSDGRLIGVVNGFEYLNQSNILEKYGFTNTILDKKQKVIVFTFDSARVPNITGIVIQGYVKQDAIAYSTSDYHNCGTDGCSVYINISSSMDKSVIQDRLVLLNLESQPYFNSSACRIVNVTYSSKDPQFNPNDFQTILNPIDGGYDTLFNNHGEIITSNIIIEKNSHLNLENLKVHKPVSAELLVEVLC